MCIRICDATPRNLWLGTNPGTAFICIMQTRCSTSSFVQVQTCLLATRCKFSSHPPFNMARASCSAPVPTQGSCHHVLLPLCPAGTGWAFTRSPTSLLRVCPPTGAAPGVPIALELCVAFVGSHIYVVPL